MQEFASGSTLFGGNVPYIEEQYERYLANPADVTRRVARCISTRCAAGASDVAHAPIIQSFIELGKHRKVAGAMVDASTMRKQVLVLRLISKFRTLGMFHADLDPLQAAGKRATSPISTSRATASRRPTSTRISTSARSRPAPTGCGSPISSPRSRRRIAARSAPSTCTSRTRRPSASSRSGWSRFARGRRTPAAQQRHILERLTAAETLERYLHTKYVGQKRFSGEGGLTMIPMLDHLIQRAGAQGVQETVIGMAHRGRLNVLVNTLGKMPARSLLGVRRQARAGVHAPAT